MQIQKVPGQKHQAFTYRSSDGIKLFCRHFKGPKHYDPNAPTLLCLPGICRHSADYLHLVTFFQAYGFNILIPDYRGRGQSEKSPGGLYDHRMVLDDLSQLIIMRNLENVLVLGTSYGGYMACALTLLHPTRIKGVILNDVSPETGSGDIKDLLNTLKTMPGNLDFDTAMQVIDRYFPWPSLTDEEKQELVKTTFHQCDKGRFHPSWDGRILSCMENDTEAADQDQWGLIMACKTLPSLIIRGAVSETFSEKTYGHVLNSLPHSSGITVKGRGHAPLLNEPEVRDGFVAFLDQHKDHLFHDQRIGNQL